MVPTSNKYKTYKIEANPMEYALFISILLTVASVLLYCAYNVVKFAKLINKSTREWYMKILAIMFSAATSAGVHLISISCIPLVPFKDSEEESPISDNYLR